MTSQAEGNVGSFNKAIFRLNVCANVSNTQILVPSSTSLIDVVFPLEAVPVLHLPVVALSLQ